MLLTRNSSNGKKINTGLESKGGKMFSKQIDLIKKIGVANSYLTKSTSD
jgi:hypothetical protein